MSDANQVSYTYECFWKMKRMTVQAATSYDAQRKAALLWGIGRRSWDVTVMRADVVHDGSVL